jgi:hypothetical protein
MGRIVGRVMYPAAGMQTRPVVRFETVILGPFGRKLTDQS